MMTSDHLFFVQQKNSFKWLKTPPKMQTYQINSKPLLDCVILPCFASCLPLTSSVWFEFSVLGTKVSVRFKLQSSGFQFSCVCLGGGWPLHPGAPVQMRVSWCQRLDGRMLSTFSMMKLRGANSVLRNCRTNRVL